MSASEHALTRIRIGFDVEQLVHELVLLRRTLLEVLREEGVIPDGQPAERVIDILDTALAASVKSYTQARDYELRRQQAEHLGFLAHRLRSPLSAAVLGLEQARRKAESPEDSRRVLDRIERSLQRVHELIDEVLLMGSLEAGALQPKLAKTTLADLLGDALTAARQSAERRGLRFRAEFEPDLEVYTDRKLVVSALEQLLENAIKYSDWGEVSLVVKKTAPGQVEFHVRDCCPGLSSEELEIIFEPFRRGRSNKGGSGLGLAIVRRAVEALGGEVDAQSDEERGCHFWFPIPRAPQ